MLACIFRHSIHYNNHLNMDRRDAVKAIAITSLTPSLVLARPRKNHLLTGRAAEHSSNWEQWPDMLWVGPDYWGNRLQDWEIRDGKAVCNVSGKNRALHCLTTQTTMEAGRLETEVTASLLNDDAPEGYVAFRLGAKGHFDDYRSAAVYGQGLDAGITTEGHLFIGEQQQSGGQLSGKELHLQLLAEPQGNSYRITLEASEVNNASNKTTYSVDNIPTQTLAGNLALIAHFPGEQENETPPSAAFAEWKISGTKLYQDDSQVWGPVCFAYYTLHQGILKLNAQLTPIEALTDHQVELQLKEGSTWKTVQTKQADPEARIAQFRVEDWSYKEEVPYRVRLTLPLLNGTQEFFYEGAIAQEPTNSSEIRTAVFSCNADYGFPDNEIAPNVARHQAHLALFLGDQFYEGTSDFPIQTAPVDKALLDVLCRWYMFGWSYREIFRNIPVAIIPDDHDVYHGNLWGESGKKAPTDEGWGYVAQDQGGYKMPPRWVNALQRMQTSHLPDPYDPTPIKQDISVYYTNWNYGGISFAILEDRKFKSAPQHILPPAAQVMNGFVQNPEFDIKQYSELDADLLGEQQMEFLEAWVKDWDQGTEMKAVLSQTNFCTVATLPEGTLIDQIVPRLEIPELGKYVEGDAPTVDMDSNGWPQKGRNQALKLMRKGFAFHIAGDQHLASTVQYGVDEFRDAGYAFAGPALNNLWPRRWWPTVPENHQPLPGQPKYSGDFLDGFGNHMTIHAVANPRQTGKEPARIYDRSTGYGIITFNKENRTINIECWPRYVDPKDPSTGAQYAGWPITITQQDNYGRTAQAWLPTLEIENLSDAVVEIIDEAQDELVYALRIKGNSFDPKVFQKGKYTIRVAEPETGKLKEMKGVQASVSKPKKPLKVTV